MFPGSVVNFVKNNLEKLLLPFLPPGNFAIRSFMNLRQGKADPLVIWLICKKKKYIYIHIYIKRQSIYTLLPYLPNIKQEFLRMMWKRCSRLGMRHEMKMHVQWM